NRVESVEEIKKQVEELYMREFISKKQAEVIDSKKIYNFFKSYIGQKILLNKEGVYREKSFNMAVSSTSINKKLDKNLYMNEYIIIQGIIDCYIDEGDCITVIDYKTDKVSNGDVETIANRYRVQLDYYTKAIEIIMNKPVKHKHLYLFDIEKEVEL
ncbi:MAG: PD-(D/E)XK nuclease family protein, partial [Clostridium sp.]